LHTGRTAIKQWAEENWGPLTMTEFTMTVQDVDGCGDLAYAWGPYTATVEVPGLEEPVKDVGKFLTVLRKQADGAWLVSVAMFNSDVPLAGSPEEPVGEESAE
jgi:ketosteroid isomerase-like protein